MLCICILTVAPQLKAQTAPSAGIVFDSLQSGNFFGQWKAYLTNTASGNPTSWEYLVTPTNCTGLPCTTFGTYTTTIASPNAIVFGALGPFIASGPVRIWQIVSNAYGSDTTSVVAIFDCLHLTSPSEQHIEYELGYLPRISAVAFSNIWVGTTEISIFGPGLTTPGVHSHGPTVYDSVMVPGRIWACGFYHDSNCFSSLEICDTINIPCFRPPVVALNTSSNGLQVDFTDSIVATTGATWLWDFGDGNTSNAVGAFISHTYATPGIYNACLSVSDTCGSTTVCAPLNLSSSWMTDLGVVPLEIFPNPSNGRFQLRSESRTVGSWTYVVQDLRSNVISSGLLPSFSGNTAQTLEVDLVDGLYLLSLEDHRGRKTVRKLLIDHSLK